MAFFRWVKYTLIACLITAAILGVLLVIRVFAFVIAVIVAVAFIALLLHYIYAARPRNPNGSKVP